MLADNRCLAGSGSVAKMLADNQRLAGSGSVAKILADNRRLVDSILGRASFAAMIGAHESVAHVLSQPRLASMVGGAALPRSALESALGSLREPIGSGLFAEVMNALEVAGEGAGESEGSTCWLARLSPVVQLGLLLVVLQSLDAIGQSVVSFAGEEAPTEYQNGARVLFALATAMYACIIARADMLSNSRTE
jgi:hypothetical protein